MKKFYPKKLKKNAAIYHETIRTMMRYGGAVDQIAKDLNLTENSLVYYIKKEGIDKQLARRKDWKWKEKSRERRTAPHSNKIGNL